MNERYFAEYLQPNRITREKVAIGRHRMAHDAQDAAERLREGRELLRVWPESPVQAALHKLERIVIRSLRLAVASALAFAAYAFLLDDSGSVRDIPISQLTPAMISDSLLSGAAFIVVVWICYGIAFSEGPNDSPFA